MKLLTQNVRNVTAHRSEDVIIKIFANYNKTQFHTTSTINNPNNMHKKVKGQAVTILNSAHHEHVWGSEAIASLFLTSALDGGERSA
jgi:hypothetical protein